MFETYGKIDRALFESIKSVFVEPWRVRLIYAAAAFLASSGIYCLIEFGFDFTSLVAFGAAIYAVSQNILMPKKIVDMNIGRLRENMGTEEIDAVTRFKEDEIEISYTGTSKRVTNIRYEYIKKITKCEQVYVLTTKSQQNLIVFRQCLDENQEKELIEFLKSKPTDIQW